MAVQPIGFSFFPETPFFPLERKSKSQLENPIESNHISQTSSLTIDEINQGSEWLNASVKYTGKELVDDKLFAHIHGDSFISGSSYAHMLEGHDMAQTLDHYVQFLQSLPNSPQVDLVLQSLKQAHLLQLENDRFFRSPSSHESAIIERAKYLANIVSAQSDDPDSPTRLNSSFTIPFGYTSNISGHAMMLQFVGSELRVFNTGEGIGHHLDKPMEGKIKYSPTLCFTDISLKLENLERFFRGFLECNYPDRSNPLPPGDQPNADYIYQQLLPILGGTAANDPRMLREEPKDFIMDQTAGICAERSLHAFLRHHLPLTNGEPLEYKRVQFLYKEETLKAYYKKYFAAPNSKPNPLSLLLFHKALTKYALRLEKLYEKKMLTQEEYRAGLAKHIALQQGLAKHVKNMRDTAENERVSALEQSKTVPSAVPAINHKEAVSFPLKTPSKSHFIQNENDKFNNHAVAFPQRPISSLEEAIDLIGQMENYFQELNRLEKLGSDAEQQMLRKQKLIHFHLFAEYLEIPDPQGKNKTIWDGLDINQQAHKTLMQRLSALSQEAFDAEFYYSFYVIRGPITQEMIFIQAKLTAIMCHLARFLEPLMCKYQFVINTLNYYLSTPFAETLSLSQQEDWNKIIECLAFNKDLPAVDLVERVENQKGINADDLNNKEILDLLLIQEVLGKKHTINAETVLQAYLDLKGGLVPNWFAQFHKQQFQLLASLRSPFAFCPQPTNVLSTGIHPNYSLSKLIPSISIGFRRIENSNPHVPQKDRFNRFCEMVEFFPSLYSTSAFNPLLSQERKETFLEKFFMHSIDYEDCPSGRKTVNNPMYENDLQFRETTAPLDVAKELSAALFNPRTRVLEVVQFFNRYPHLLQEPAYQKTLELGLFSPNSLQNYLAADPNFTNVLSDFIQKRIDSSQKQKDLLAELFFLKLSHLLKPFIAKTGINDAIFPDALEKCLNLLKRNDLKDTEKRAAAFLLLDCAKKLPLGSLENSPELSKALLCAKAIIWSTPRTNLDPYTSLELDILWNKLYPPIKNCLENNVELTNEVADAVLEAIVHPDFTGRAEQPKWTFDREDRELIYTEDKKKGWILDLRAGSLFFAGKPYLACPHEIEEDPSFLQVFGERSYHLSSEGFGLARVEYEIDAKTWGTAWIDYGYVSGRKLSLTCSIRKFLKNQQAVFLPQIPEVFRRLFPTLVVSNHHFWHSQETDEIFIVDQTDQIVATISLEDNPLNKREKQIVAVHAGNLRLTREYLPLSNKFWWEKDLTLFESPTWIELWMPNQAKDMTGAIVKLPRFGLDFEVRNSEHGLQLFCLQEPGFVLESSNYLSIDQQINKVLLLKDLESGNRKALCPYAEEQNGKIPFLEIPINKQGNLAPSSAEQHLFLAKLALTSSEHPKRTEEAERQLRLAWSLHKPSLISQMFLFEIIELLVALKEASVAGVGLKLLCQYEQWRHQQPQTKTISEIDETGLGKLEDPKTKQLVPFLGLKRNEVSNLFFLYLKRHRNDPLAALSKEEQQQILDFASTPSIFRQLTSLHHPAPALPVASGRKITAGFCDSTSSEISWETLMRRASRNWYDEHQVLNFNRVTFLTEEEFFLSLKALLTLATSHDLKAREEVKKRLSLLRLPKKNQTALNLKNILLNAVESPDAYRDLLPLLPEALPDRSFSMESRTAITDFLSKAPKKEAEATAAINPIANPLKIKLKKNGEKAKKEEMSLPIVWEQANTVDAAPFLELSNKESSISLEPLFDYSRLKLEDAEKTWLSDAEKDFALREKQISQGHRVVESSLGVLKQSLVATAAAEKDRLDQLSDSLLTLINRAPDGQLKRIKRVLNAATGRYREFKSAEQLIFAYLKGSVESWKALNETLSEDECKFLDAEMSCYLQHAATLGRIQRQLSQIQDLEALHNKRGSSPSIDLEIEEASEALAQDLSATRVYGPHTELSISTSRLCLAFEFVSDLSIRPKQIRIVQNILEGKIEDQEREFISQLIMGGGKSKVILPLLSLLLADGKRLAILCIPKEQIDVQKEYLNQLSGGFFERRAHTLSIDRETTMDASFVKTTWKLLKQIREKGEYLIVTPETIQALELKWHELRRSGELQDPKMRRQFAKIFDLLSQFGYLLLDEADRILDIRTELNFTEGDSLSIDESICAQFAELYELLAREKELGLMQNQQSARFDIAWPSLQKRLAQAMTKSLCARCQIENPMDQEALADYITNLKLAAPAFLKDISAEERDRVGLMRAQLTVFLPITLTKTGQKDYTFSKNPSVVSAIPASFCIPKERSRFGTPYEAVNYTLQLILQQNLTIEHLKQAASKMQEEANYLNSMHLPFEKSSLVMAFKELLPEKNLLDPFTDDDFAWISEQLQPNIEFALAFAQMALLPQIETYPYKATHNAHNLVSLFHKTFGFTATPWNWGCWPKQLGQPDLDPGTDGLTLGLLMQKIQQQGQLGIQVATLPEYDGTDDSLKAKIETLLDLFIKNRPDSRYKAIIDLGAQFKGVPNKQIAQSLLDYCHRHPQTPSVKGVIFFEKDQMFVLANNGKIIPYTACQLKPEELFTFYDNAHVIGADIPQEVFAEAIVTIGENLYLKDLLQAVGRMRGLRRLQSVSFFVPSAIAEVINQTCHQDRQAPLSLKDIFHFSALNQSRVQIEDTYRAAKSEIPALIRKTVVEKLHALDKNRQFAEADQLFIAFDALDGIFLSKQPFSPWEDFSNPVNEISAEKSLLEIRDRWIKDLKKISQDGKVDAAFINGLLNTIRAWKPLSLERMPETIERPESSSADNRVEAVQEVNVEIDIETDLDLDQDLTVDLHQHSRFYWFNNQYDPFHPEKSPEIFHPLHKMLNDPLMLAQSRASLCQFSSTFQGPIYISNNQGVDPDPEIVNTPFGRHLKLLSRNQKPFEHVLIRETDDPDKPLEFYLISPDDLAFFQDKLSSETSKPLEEQAKVWIYTIYNKDYGLKTNGAAPDKWLEHPSFLKEMAKIHLLSGFSYLTSKEETAMKELIGELANPEVFSELIKATRDTKISTREKAIYANMLAQQTLTRGVSPKLHTKLKRTKAPVIKPVELSETISSTEDATKIDVPKDAATIDAPEAASTDLIGTAITVESTNATTTIHPQKAAATIAPSKSHAKVSTASAGVVLPEVKVDTVIPAQSTTPPSIQKARKVSRLQRFFQKIKQGFRNLGKGLAKDWKRFIGTLKKTSMKKHAKNIEKPIKNPEEIRKDAKNKDSSQQSVDSSQNKHNSTQSRKARRDAK